MSAPSVTVEVALGIAGPTDFILDHPVRGVLDGTTYTLASGYTDVTADSIGVSINRGRFSQLWDSVDAGSCTISLNNEDRDFDPSHMASPYAGYIVPGRMARVTANDTVIWTGYVDDWELEYDVSGRSTASVISTDALGMLGQLQFDEWTSEQTTAGAKLHQVINRDEVSWDDVVDFDAGLELLQADAVSWGSNVLNYCQLIARSELGYFFASAEGVLTFRERTVGGGDSVASFGDGGIPFSGIRATIGSDLLFARAGVDREGGTNQTATVTDPMDWRDRYGPLRSITMSGLLLDDDAQSLAIAEYLLLLYDTPRYRVSEITVKLHGLSEAQQNTVLGIDVTDVITVTFTPKETGDAIVQPVLVQGIRHQLTPAQHTVTFSLVDGSTPYFRLDDTTYGVLDVGILGF